MVEHNREWHALNVELKGVQAKDCGVATVVSLKEKDAKTTIMTGAASNKLGE